MSGCAACARTGTSARKQSRGCTPSCFVPLASRSRAAVTLPHLRGNELDDIAHEAADDALMSVLAHLDDFRGLSRFTTWVYKFAIFEAAVKLRRRAWQGREVPLEPEAWTQFADPVSSPPRRLEQSELLLDAAAGRYGDPDAH